MLQYEVGQIVYSKCGRDKSKPFIILNIKDEYLFLVDGNLRKLDKPKKKKIKHVQFTHYIDNEIKYKIENNDYLLDSDIRKSIKDYCKEN